VAASNGGDRQGGVAYSRERRHGGETMLFSLKPMMSICNTRTNSNSELTEINPRLELAWID
jgi:hypothetical protein